MRRCRRCRCKKASTGAAFQRQVRHGLMNRSRSRGDGRDGDAGIAAAMENVIAMHLINRLIVDAEKGIGDIGDTSNGVVENQG